MMIRILLSEAPGIQLIDVIEGTEIMSSPTLIKAPKGILVKSSTSKPRVERKERRRHQDSHLGWQWTRT